MIDCTKCGFMDNGVILFPSCIHIDERIQKVLEISKFLKTEKDIIEKCHSIHCVNDAEYHQGLESTDKVLEESETYHLLEEIKNTKWVLILIHDGLGNQASEEEKIFNKALGRSNQVMEKQIGNMTFIPHSHKMDNEYLSMEQLLKINEIILKLSFECKDCPDCKKPENPSQINDISDLFKPENQTKICDKHQKKIRDMIENMFDNPT